MIATLTPVLPKIATSAQSAALMRAIGSAARHARGMARVPLTGGKTFVSLRDRGVGGRRKNLKVFDPVVRFDSVQMVDVLVGGQRSPNVLFHQESVFECVPVAVPNSPIPRHGHTGSPAIESVTDKGAVLPATATEPRGGQLKRLAAILADALNLGRLLGHRIGPFTEDDEGAAARSVDALPGFALPQLYQKALKLTRWPNVYRFNSGVM